MFIISSCLAAPNADPQPPSANDLFEIQDILNQSRFVHRVKPGGHIEPIVDQVVNQVFEDTGRYTCHTIARRIVAQFPGQGLQRAAGYLVKRRDLSQLTIGKQTNLVASLSLRHHSVIVDSQGNYVECISGFYPINDYAFIPHASGAKGYFLKASWQDG